MRYRLKKQYFNGIPANEVRTTSPLTTMTDMEWKQLVDMWSIPKHKEKCLKNKDSRELVQYHQMIGSRSYVAQCYVLAQMEDYVAQPIEEGKDPKTHVQAVAHVLPKSTFLRNVGMQST